MPRTSPGSGMPVRCAKAVARDVIVKPVLAQLDADFRRADVGGFGDDAFHREHAVSFVVVQNPAGKSKMPVLAIERVAQADDLIVQRAGDDDDFES